ncbi:MAG: SPOR domain-containing protein, partial [Actinomycetota bacterium]
DPHRHPAHGVSDAPPPQEPEEPPAGDAEAQPPQEPVCASCGAPIAPDQTYCLECGAPTPAAPRLRTRGRLGLVVGLGLIVAGLGAGALAYALSGEDGGSRGAGGTVTSGTVSGGTISLPPDTTSVATEFPTATEPTVLPTDTTFTDIGTDTATDTVDTSAFTSDWPSGQTAFTAILSSVGDLGEAQGTAERVRATGEAAGILFSSDHAGLRPGYYVVFSGVFTTRDAAEAQARKLAADFPGAYVRRVVG